MGYYYDVIMQTRKSAKKVQKERKMTIKNVAGKTRKVAQAYASWTDPRSGWKYKLLKSYQGDNSKEYARWFVDVEGYGHDLGDEYVRNMQPGILAATDLVVDLEVWSSVNWFKAWAYGEKVGY